MRNIVILCDIIHVNAGGLAKAVLNRSTLFCEKGHSVTILTIEADKDYKMIENELKKRDMLNPSVKIINIYNYYKKKNTRKSLIKKIISRVNYYTKKAVVHELGYKIINEYDTKRKAYYLRSNNYLMHKKWRKGGSLEYIDYFNENGSLKKRVHYLHGFIIKEVSYEAGQISQKKYYTDDGFCYLIELFNNFQKNLIFLFSRNKEVMTFNNEKKFHKEFITEICKGYDDKPYLICDGSGPTPTISNIDSEVAYKISQLHSNPYIKPYCFGSPMREVGILDGHLEKVDAFITLTEKQRKDIIKEFGDHNNTYVIPNFVLNNEELELTKDANKISMFIRFSPEKNVEDAIKAFKLVVNKKEKATLDIFGRVGSVHGEHYEFNKIQKLIKKLHLEHNVFLKGFTDEVDVEMSKSIATLLTSKFEGFGMVILESMFNSTPVISYDINYGPSDLIDHEIDGFLVKPNKIEQMAEYIIELLEDTEKAKKMGLIARKKVLKKYSSNIIIQKWENLFEIVSKYDIQKNT